ncbi:MAG: hypothetical protein LBE35_02665 [Clostridiales bacterium]|nr:hypothetical protein [Clostridiales bacterium]
MSFFRGERARMGGLKAATQCRYAAGRRATLWLCCESQREAPRHASCGRPPSVARKGGLKAATSFPA